MNNEKFQEFLTMSWEQVLSTEEEIMELFKPLNIKNLEKVQILSRTILAYGRLTLIFLASNGNGKSARIIIDVTSGVPTWEQFINVTYDQGKDTDLKIIIYGKDFEEFSSDAPAGGFNEIANLVTRNTRCGVKTLLIKGVDFDHNGQKIVRDCEVRAGRSCVTVDEKRILPSKRQVQEAEFWMGYYYPQRQGAWSVGIDDDIIHYREPSDGSGYNLKTQVRWDDEGFFFDVVGDAGSEAIKWIWANERGRFEEEYPGHSISLKTENGATSISIRIYDISMTKLIEMEPKVKKYYGEMVFSEEYRFYQIAQEAVEDYFNEMKSAQTTAALA